MMTMGKYIGLSGSPFGANGSITWLLDPSSNTIIACKYLSDSGITCAKQELP